MSRLFSLVLAGTSLVLHGLPQSPVVYTVGVGQTHTEIHQIPALKAGDKIRIIGRPTPYLAKIGVNVSDVEIEGVNDSQGNRVVLDGRGAVENKGAAYWTDGVSAQGIITVAPGPSGATVKNVKISGCKFIGARNVNAGFTAASGVKKGWNTSCAGVALYRCENVTITGCAIHECDNGIFGKSYGEAGKDLKNITVEWTNFLYNGVAGSDRQHNSYLEGINTLYQFCGFHPPKPGSAGCNLKDRGVRTVIRYCRIEGGARLIDLVDPEDGAATMTKAPGFGRNDIVGCLLVNPAVGGSQTAIHLGFDGMAANAQKRLMMEYCTFVNLREQQSHWYTYAFKGNGSQEFYLANNIFHAFTTTGKTPSEFRFAVDEGGPGSWVGMVSNFVPNWASKGGVNSIWQWDAQIKAPDPGFVNQVAGDFRLASNSRCLGKATAVENVPWNFEPPLYSYDPSNWSFAPRAGLTDLGAAQMNAAPPPPPPVSKELKLGEVQGVSLADWKASHGTGWWPWGITPFDYDGDGKVDLCVTQHNTGSRILKNLGNNSWQWVDVGSNLGGQFKARAWDLNKDGKPDLIFRDASKAQTAFINQNGKFVPINFKYSEGDPSLYFAHPTAEGFGHEASYDSSPPSGARWNWNGTTLSKVPYTHPMVAKVQQAEKDYIKALYAKPGDVNRFMRTWWIEAGGIHAIGGWASYGGDKFGLYLDENGNKLSIGLPQFGSPVHVEDLDGNGKPDWILSGSGLYLADATGKYTKKAGPLSDFLSVTGEYFHQVESADMNGDGMVDLLVNNPRSRDVRVFAQTSPGEFKQVLSVYSWDGEGCALADVNGDGKKDLVAGSGDAVRVWITQ